MASCLCICIFSISRNHIDTVVVLCFYILQRMCHSAALLSSTSSFVLLFNVPFGWHERDIWNLVWLWLTKGKLWCKRKLVLLLNLFSKKIFLPSSYILVKKEILLRWHFQGGQLWETLTCILWQNAQKMENFLVEDHCFYHEISFIEFLDFPFLSCWPSLNKNDSLSLAYFDCVVFLLWV